MCAIYAMNKKGADPTARMCRVVCTLDFLTNGKTLSTVKFLKLHPKKMIRFHEKMAIQYWKTVGLKSSSVLKHACSQYFNS